MSNAPNQPNGNNELSNLVDKLTPLPLLCLIIDTTVMMAKHLAYLARKQLEESDSRWAAIIKEEFDTCYKHYLKQCALMVRVDLMTPERYQEILNLSGQAENH